MDKVLSISVGEIALKGLNRRYFEDKLISQIKKCLHGLPYKRIYKEQGKIYIEAEGDLEKIINRVKKVFGIVHISPCVRIEKNMEELKKAVVEVTKDKIKENSIKTFKVETNRVDKKFPIKSPEVSRQMGAVILKNIEGLSVDVSKPDLYVYVDIKEYIYVYTDKIKGYGGLPIGTNGKGLLLLSGGIDSPVAGFLMAKRGVEVSAMHFHSYPFTSERAEEKVKSLAKILSIYTGKIRMYSVNILDIQKEINKKCPEDQMTILSRRFMMRIAERVANENNINALITGESLGQVASQTIESLSVTNSSVNMPIFRPLIGLDKTQIIEIAKDIETYETSILPYDDCCTLFLPKHPVTKPKLEVIEESERNLDVEELINKALETMTIHEIE